MTASVPQSVMWAARFFFVDSAVSWALLGATVVQLCKYLPHRWRDERWQVWSLAIVFTLNTLVVGLNLMRMIVSNALHYGDRSYKNNFGNRPHVPLSWFLGLTVIVLVQLLVLHRVFIFGKRLQPCGMSRKKKVALVGLFSLEILAALLGALSYALSLRFREYSQLVIEIQKPGMPPFFVLQVSWSVCSVVIVLAQASFISWEIRLARRISAMHSASTHKNLGMADELLRQIHRGFIVNWLLVAGAHVVYLASITSQQGAMAGRACASIAGLYTFSLFSQVVLPWETRTRLIAEKSITFDLPKHSRLPSPIRKHLYPLAHRKKGPKRTPGGSAVVVRTFDVLSSIHHLSDFGHLSDDDDMRSMTSLEGLEGDLAVASARRIGLGSSVWVEGGPSAGRKQLTVNVHSSPPPPRPLTDRSLFPPAASSSGAIPPPTRSTFSFRLNPPPSLPTPVAQGDPRRQRRSFSLSASGPRGNPSEGHLSFIDSFPAGPTTTRSHGVFDPDDMTLSFFTLLEDPSSPESDVPFLV